LTNLHQIQLFDKLVDTLHIPSRDGKVPIVAGA
jgi:hypothetical protein